MGIPDDHDQQKCRGRALATPPPSPGALARQFWGHDSRLARDRQTSHAYLHTYQNDCCHRYGTMQRLWPNHADADRHLRRFRVRKTTRHRADLRHFDAHEKAHHGSPQTRSKNIAHLNAAKPFILSRGCLPLRGYVLACGCAHTPLPPLHHTRACASRPILSADLSKSSSASGRSLSDCCVHSYREPKAPSKPSSSRALP